MEVAEEQPNDDDGDNDDMSMIKAMAMRRDGSIGPWRAREGGTEERRWIWRRIEDESYDASSWHAWQACGLYIMTGSGRLVEHAVFCFYRRLPNSEQVSCGVQCLRFGSNHISIMCLSATPIAWQSGFIWFCWLQEGLLCVACSRGAASAHALHDPAPHQASNGCEECTSRFLGV